MSFCHWKASSGGKTIEILILSKFCLCIDVVTFAFLLCLMHRTSCLG